MQPADMLHFVHSYRDDSELDGARLTRFACYGLPPTENTLTNTPEIDFNLVTSFPVSRVVASLFNLCSISPHRTLDLTLTICRLTVHTGSSP